jgi:hypothetical protein
MPDPVFVDDTPDPAVALARIEPIGHAAMWFASAIRAGDDQQVRQARAAILREYAAVTPQPPGLDPVPPAASNGAEPYRVFLEVVHRDAQRSQIVLDRDGTQYGMVRPSAGGIIAAVLRALADPDSDGEQVVVSKARLAELEGIEARAEAAAGLEQRGPLDVAAVHCARLIWKGDES